MTSIATRALCALLSTVGAAGLVAFANPANSFPAPHYSATTPTVAVVAPADTAHRG